MVNQRQLANSELQMTLISAHPFVYLTMKLEVVDFSSYEHWHTNTFFLSTKNPCKYYLPSSSQRTVSVVLLEVGIKKHLKRVKGNPGKLRFHTWFIQIFINDENYLWKEIIQLVKFWLIFVIQCNFTAQLHHCIKLMIVLYMYTLNNVTLFSKVIQEIFAKEQ